MKDIANGLLMLNDWNQLQLPQIQKDWHEELIIPEL